MGLPQDSRTNTVTSSAGLDPAALGHFDLRQLKLYREMAEKHLKAALSEISLTAAADPGQYVLDYFLTEFAESAYLTWADARGLIGALFGDLPNPFYESIAVAAIKDSTNAYQELMRMLIGRKGFRVPIQGEFFMADKSKKTGALVQYGDVRPLLTRLGGGSTEANIPLMGGITSGRTMREYLRTNGIDIKEKIWLYGYEDPRRNFNGHEQLDGLVFTDWDDDGLVISPQDAWLRRTHYIVGDHTGCGCCVAPWIPNMGEPYTLELT